MFGNLFGGKNSIFNNPLGDLSGGKNSVINKPLGHGRDSVKNNPTKAIAPIAQGSLDLANNARGSIFGGDDNTSMSSLSAGDVENFMAKGEAKGEELTGSTLAESGEGRKDVRNRLTGILEGNSAGASALKQDQNQQAKALRSQQAIAGGGQMNQGQQEALKRQC